ncbi:MAG TPA: response regulator [Bryobacteraceae bacterium]|nr:response regulator [Bryobacteraceae bacterium]
MTINGEQSQQVSQPVILVVDDEAIVLRVLRGILANHGYRVLAAVSGKEAIEVFRREPHIDLLLTDVVMPGMTGPELAELLLTLDPGLRMLFTAGMPDSPLIRECIIDRDHAFIAKPFLPSELLAAVRQVLASPRLAARAQA